MIRATYIKDYENWSKEFRFFREISIRFGETDMFGHLNNVVAFTYFEEARTKLFEELGVIEACLNDEYEGIVVTADLQCDYVKQVFYGDTLKVYVKIEKIGNSSVDLHYKAVNQRDEVCLVGRGLIVQVSKRTGKSLTWSPEWREKIVQNKMGTTLFDR